jgi:hypothetical protein
MLKKIGGRLHPHVKILETVSIFQPVLSQQDPLLYI